MIELGGEEAEGESICRNWLLGSVDEGGREGVGNRGVQQTAGPFTWSWKERGRTTDLTSARRGRAQWGSKCVHPEGAGRIRARLQGPCVGSRLSVGKGPRPASAPPSLASLPGSPPALLPRPPCHL